MAGPSKPQRADQKQSNIIEQETPSGHFGSKDVPIEVAAAESSVEQVKNSILYY